VNLRRQTDSAPFQQQFLLICAFAANVAWAAPCVYIEDYPLFSWRGVMLDPARHFVNKQEVKQILDAPVRVQAGRNPCRPGCHCRPQRLDHQRNRLFTLPGLSQPIE
jgi:hypothetical protein